MDSETVLILDDEEMVLTSLSTYLALETDYEVVTFTSAKRALEHLAQHDVGIIISDFLMPEMDGIKFLAQAKELRPDTPRVILTGYADKENAIKAINEVQLFQYVEKPWDNAQLTTLVRSGLERQHLIRSLYSTIEQLERTEADLSRLRRGLVRAFA